MHNESKVRTLILTEPVLQQIHAVVHEAYGQYADSGYSFNAVKQNFEETAQRVLRPGTVVLGSFHNKTLVATVAVVAYQGASRHSYVTRSTDVCLEQFAVLPRLQRSGLGTTLFTAAEELAVISGCGRIFVDTPSQAEHLVRLYRHLGFHLIGDYEAFSTGQRNSIMMKAFS